MFWAESIVKGWDNIYYTDGALGCAIWAARDDVFYIPDTVEKKHQKHSDGSATGYGEWGVVLDSFGREKPEAYILKKAFSPVKISNIKITKKYILFNAENRFFHTNLSDVNLICKADGKTVFNDFLPTITEPKNTAEIKISGDFSCCKTLSFEFFLNGLSVESFAYKHNVSKISYEKENNHIVKPFFENNIKIFKEYTGKKGKSPEKFRLSFKEKDNELCIKMKPATLSAFFSHGNKWGIRIPLGTNVSHILWETKPFVIEFPDDHIGRTKGVCYANDYVLTPYGEKPDCRWSKDAFNYFCLTKKKIVRLFQMTSKQNGRILFIFGYI